MRLLVSTLLLGLAWFAALNLVLCAAAWIATRFVLASSRPVSGAVLLALRLLPAVAAACFALAVFLPAHVRFEPAESSERFGVILAGLSLAGVWLVAHAGWRVRHVRAASRLARGWAAAAVASRVGDAYVVHAFPGVSLAGVLRTRILIGSSARQALTAEELDVAVAHEHAHRCSLDNLKRCLMFCAPDFFGRTAAAARLEERWRAQAECEADARAVGGDEQRAVHLAAALLKVARIGTRSTAIAPSPVWSAFNEPPLLEIRIRSLVSGRATVPAAPRHRRRLAIGLAAAAAVGAVLAQVPLRVHELTEALVAVLP